MNELAWMPQTKFRRELGYSESGFRKLRDQKMVEGFDYKRGTNGRVWINTQNAMNKLVSIH